MTVCGELAMQNSRLLGNKKGHPMGGPFIVLNRLLVVVAALQGWPVVAWLRGVGRCVGIVV
jgi:hypothetical protein